MTKGLLIITLIIVILLMVCPIIITMMVSKNEKKKDLFKKIINGVFIVDIIAILILLSLWITPIKNNDLTLKKASTTKASSSEEVSEDELSIAGFNELSLSQYLELIKSSEKTIILVARPTCYYCQQFTPVLKQVKDEMNLTINYINTDNLSEEDWTVFQSSLDYLNSEEWGTPLTLIVENGEVIDENNGYVEFDTIKDFFTKNGFGE